MSDSHSLKSRLTALPKAAMLGFALSGLVAPQEARAYYLAGWLLLSATTTGVGATIAVGVYITVKTVDGTPQFLEPGDTTRRMIEAALLSTRGDLTMQVELVLTSPTAFAQLDREMALGAGASVDAFAQATGLGAADLVAAWSRAGGGRPVGSEDEARALVISFLKEIGPSLQVPADVVAGFSWQLVGEGDEVGGGRATRQLAHWLGVTPADVTAATRVALASIGLDEGEATRAQLYEDPTPFLTALATELESHHRDAISARMSEIVSVMEPGVAGVEGRG